MNSQIREYYSNNPGQRKFDFMGGFAIAFLPMLLAFMYPSLYVLFFVSLIIDLIAVIFANRYVKIGVLSFVIFAFFLPGACFAGFCGIGAATNDYSSAFMLGILAIFVVGVPLSMMLSRKMYKTADEELQLVNTDTNPASDGANNVTQEEIAQATSVANHPAQIGPYADPVPNSNNPIDNNPNTSTENKEEDKAE